MRLVALPNGPAPLPLLLCGSGSARSRFHGSGGGGVVVVCNGKLLVLLGLQLALVKTQRPLEDIFDLTEVVEMSMLDYILLQIILI